MSRQFRRCTFDAALAVQSRSRQERPTGKSDLLARTTYWQERRSAGRVTGFYRFAPGVGSTRGIDSTTLSINP